MDYIITTGIGIILGFFIGLVSLNNLFSTSNNLLLEGSAMCATNGDLVKIGTRFGGYTAFCGNGAEFKLKEK